MSQIDDVDVQRAIQEVLRRASIDSDFRALAIRDGNAAMRAVSQVTPPAGVNFRFVDNSSNSRTYPLPDFRGATEELSESELDQVAGGCDMATCLMTM